MSMEVSQSMWLNVRDVYGKQSQVSFESDSKIEKLKENVMKLLGINENECKYKLVLVNDTMRSLCDSNNAKDENLKNQNNLLIIKTPNHKLPVAPNLNSSGVYDAPTESQIQEATAGITSRSRLPPRVSVSNDSTTSQVEQTLRKVLLALLDLSYKFMHFETDDGSSVPKKPVVDSQKLEELVNMGFSEKISKHALLLFNMDKKQAMEWLLNNPHDEVNIEEEPTPSTSSSTVTYKYRSRKKSFVPNQNHLANLLAMGFSRDDSVLALKVSGNNANAACEWLLSDRPPFDDPDASLSPDCELYKSLLRNPTIHIGLHDPKVVEALEDMVENPWRRNNWAYESAVGNVILQILKLYNKYSITSENVN